MVGSAAIPLLACLLLAACGTPGRPAASLRPSGALFPERDDTTHVGTAATGPVGPGAVAPNRGRSGAPVDANSPAETND